MHGQTQDQEPPAMEPEPAILEPEPAVMAPEKIVNLADTQCLPQFEMIIKSKQEFIAIEIDSDSEKEDTDGYLSEEIDIKKSQIGIFNSSYINPNKLETQKDGDNSAA